MKKTQKSGYSLLEVLIVLTIIGIILPAVFSIITVILRQQAVIYELSTVKREGDSILNLLKTKIANEAVGIINDDTPPVSQCVAANPNFIRSDNDINQFNFVTATGTPFNYSLSGNTLNLVPAALHSTKVKISDVRFSCYRKNTLSPIMVTINYKVEFNRTKPNPSLGTAPSLNYQTRILLRNSL